MGPDGFDRNVVIYESTLRNITEEWASQWQYSNDKAAGASSCSPTSFHWWGYECVAPYLCSFLYVLTAWSGDNTLCCEDFVSCVT